MDTHPSRRTSRSALGLLLALILALVAAACGADDDSYDSASAVSDAADDAAFDFEVETGLTRAEAPGEPEAAQDFDNVAMTDGVTTGSAAGQPVAQLPDIGRDIIYTAELDLGSTDVTSATREAIRTVEAHGGFLFSQETRGGNW